MLFTDSVAKMVMGLALRQSLMVVFCYTKYISCITRVFVVVCTLFTNI